MTSEIIAAIAVGAFIVLVIFSVLTLMQARKTLKKTDLVLWEVHKLLLDVKRKSEGLEALFAPLHALRKKEDSLHISEIIECVTSAIRLFSKLKKEVSK
jgi:uncharacterized protein YoxC